MLRSLVVTAALVAALLGSARAEPCPPAVALAGDAALVGAVGGVLTARGIALDPPGCPAIAARIEPRDGALVVDIDGVERIVGDTATAATVIESFSRVDVATPLLAIRPVTRAAPIVDAPAPDVEVEAVTIPANQSTRGVQVFGAFETSFASDRTRWHGAHVGVCVTLGPVCAAARLRVAGVTSGPGVWKDQLDRQSVELLIGIDIPFAVRGVTVAPGFAAGLGQMYTFGATRALSSETGGPRADVHATVSIPIARRLAIDLFTAVDLTQETRVEWGPTMGTLPDEPRALARFGAGLRYGGL